ncbi:hypothetical protein N7504_005876 [Penicillium tannophilum]|nr:hypothetical protein N7504_005876 [Penicillium tannophilum]
MTEKMNTQVEKFPNDPIFNQLASLAAQVKRPIIHDPSGLKIDYNRLLNDVSRLRVTLRESLPPSSFDKQGIIDQERPYVCILADADYNFIVSFITILALGGVVVPLASGVLPEEAKYFFQKTKSSILLASENRIKQAVAIKDYIFEQASTDIAVVQIPQTEETPQNFEISIDDHLTFTPAQPAVVIFTSGTTGRPKGVVFPRRRYHYPSSADYNRVLISYRPPHWVGGLRSLIQPVLQGHAVHILPNRPGPEVFWEYFRKVPFTHMSLNPTSLRELRDYFEKNLSHLPQEDLDKYLQNLRNLNDIASSGAMIEDSTLQFWRDILGKNIINNSYALTETGPVTKTQTGSTMKYSVGVPWPWVSLKLSDGDYGEALVKTHLAFSEYLDDEEATKRAFDEEGYFRTGDILRRVGDQYVFEGRVSTDFVLFYGYRIPIVELEGSLIDLPYIKEAYVIGAPDHEAKELAAAIVRLKACTDNGEAITLKKIRKDLSATLATHKLPALLRILQDGEEIPRTAGGKSIKPGLLQKFFGIENIIPKGYSWPHTEFWGNGIEQGLRQTRPWDWCGLQRSD